MSGQNPLCFGEFADWNNQQQYSSWSHNYGNANHQFVSTNNNQWYKNCFENYLQQVSAPTETTWSQIPVQTNNYRVNSSPTLEELLQDLNVPVQRDQQREYTNKVRGTKHNWRHRTAFTNIQTETLERVFKKKMYVNNAERAKLGNMLGLTERTVRVWFQNRRMKKKRSEQNGIDEAGTSSVSSSSNIVESIERDIKSCHVVNNQVCLTAEIYERLGALLQTFLPDVTESSHGSDSNTLSNGYSSCNTYVMLDKYDTISPVSHNSSILF